MQSGLNPSGSLTAIRISFNSITNEYEPTSRRISLRTASTMLFRSRSFTSRCAMTSVSESERKMCPCRVSSRRNSSELTRFPLCAIAIVPPLKLIVRGCTFSSSDPPVVEYLTCPIPTLPGTESRSVFLKTHGTMPMPLIDCVLPSCVIEIPADSCPLCWSEYSE